MIIIVLITTKNAKSLVAQAAQNDYSCVTLNYLIY